MGGSGRSRAGRSGVRVDVGLGEALGVGAVAVEFGLGGRKGDLEGASTNLQTALTLEPDNQGFKDELAELKHRLIHGPR